jgi:hypothetical protein
VGHGTGGLLCRAWPGVLRPLGPRTHGLLGISDNHQRLCFALALWNTRDPILKERLFGVTPRRNHGEDVKCYFYLDATPTHSYMRALTNIRSAVPVPAPGRGERAVLDEPELELLETGVFDDDP